MIRAFIALCLLSVTAFAIPSTSQPTRSVHFSTGGYVLVGSEQAQIGVLNLARSAHFTGTVHTMIVCAVENRGDTAVPSYQLTFGGFANIEQGGFQMCGTFCPGGLAAWDHVYNEMPNPVPITNQGFGPGSDNHVDVLHVDIPWSTTLSAGSHPVLANGYCGVSLWGDQWVWGEDHHYAWHQSNVYVWVEGTLQ